MNPYLMLLQQLIGGTQFLPPQRANPFGPAQSSWQFLQSQPRAALTIPTGISPFDAGQSLSRIFGSEAQGGFQRDAASALSSFGSGMNRLGVGVPPMQFVPNFGGLA